MSIVILDLRRKSRPKITGTLSPGRWIKRHRLIRPSHRTVNLAAPPARTTPLARLKTARHSLRRTERCCKRFNTSSPNKEALAPVSNKAGTSRPAMTTVMNGAGSPAGQPGRPKEGARITSAERAFPSGRRLRFPSAGAAGGSCASCALLLCSENSAADHGCSRDWHPLARFRPPPGPQAARSGCPLQHCLGTTCQPQPGGVRRCMGPKRVR